MTRTRTSELGSSTFENVTARGGTYDVLLTLVREGHPAEVGRARRREVVTAGRVWEVRLGEEVIGYVHHKVIDREQRSPGSRLVNSRWQALVWLASDSMHSAPKWREATSRRMAVEKLLWDMDVKEARA